MPCGCRFFIIVKWACGCHAHRTLRPCPDAKAVGNEFAVCAEAYLEALKVDDLPTEVFVTGCLECTGYVCPRQLNICDNQANRDAYQEHLPAIKRRSEGGAVGRRAVEQSFCVQAYRHHVHLFHACS